MNDSGDSEEQAEKKQNVFLACLKNFFFPFWRRLHDPRFFVEVLALLGLVVYATISYRQWRDSNRNFTVDERHSLFVVSVGMPEPQKDKFVQWEVDLKNTGKTAAKGITITFDATILESAAPHINFDYSHSIPEQIPLVPPNADNVFPIAKFSGSSPLQRDRFSQGDIDDLTSGKTYLIVYAKGTYYDIFGDLHWLKYCAWRGSPKESTVYNTMQCTAYNDMGEGPLPD
jgi:hypothetical protein